MTPYLGSAYRVTSAARLYQCFRGLPMEVATCTMDSMQGCIASHRAMRGSEKGIPTSPIPK